ncbi:MAG: hypothetical protein Tsb002_18600 [Wenzhouxiangellaceae bacterium]
MRAATAGGMLLLAVAVSTESVRIIALPPGFSTDSPDKAGYTDRLMPVAGGSRSLCE